MQSKHEIILNNPLFKDIFDGETTIQQKYLALFRMEQANSYDSTVGKSLKEQILITKELLIPKYQALADDETLWLALNKLIKDIYPEIGLCDIQQLLDSNVFNRFVRINNLVGPRVFIEFNGDATEYYDEEDIERLTKECTEELILGVAANAALEEEFLKAFYHRLINPLKVKAKVSSDFDRLKLLCKYQILYYNNTMEEAFLSDDFLLELLEISPVQNYFEKQAIQVGEEFFNMNDTQSQIDAEYKNLLEQVLNYALSINHDLDRSVLMELYLRDVYLYQPAMVSSSLNELVKNTKGPEKALIKRLHKQMVSGARIYQ